MQIELRYTQGQIGNNTVKVASRNQLIADKKKTGCVRTGETINNGGSVGLVLVFT